MDEKKIGWWRIDLGEEEIEAVARAIREKKVSQGEITARLEEGLARELGAPYAVATTSGTMALQMAYMALGVRPGDEVIVPDRTFIATAHPALILGARVRLVDTFLDRPLMDPSLVEEKISPRTKVIVAAHLNGAAADLAALQEIADRHGIALMEDACQAFGSRLGGKCLGTFGRFGCFSLGLAKAVTTGQGGFVVCNSEEDYRLLRLIRNHGVEDVREDKTFYTLASNFKFNDLLAAVGLVQLSRVEKKLKRQRDIFRCYRQGLARVPYARVFDVDIDGEEYPLRAEYLVSEREKFIAMMAERGIHVVSELPSLHKSPHLGAQGESFPNSMVYNDHLVILPSGPDQPLENVARTVEVMQGLVGSLRPFEQGAASGR